VGVAENGAKVDKYEHGAGESRVAMGVDAEQRVQMAGEHGANCTQAVAHRMALGVRGHTEVPGKDHNERDELQQELMLMLGNHVREALELDAARSANDVLQRQRQRQCFHRRAEAAAAAVARGEAEEDVLVLVLLTGAEDVAEDVAQGGARNTAPLVAAVANARGADCQTIAQAAMHATPDDVEQAAGDSHGAGRHEARHRAREVQNVEGQHHDAHDGDLAAASELTHRDHQARRPPEFAGDSHAPAMPAASTDHDNDRPLAHQVLVSAASTDHDNVHPLGHQIPRFYPNARGVEDADGGDLHQWCDAAGRCYLTATRDGLDERRFSCDHCDARACRGGRR
jgi:hypothetical protein